MSKVHRRALLGSAASAAILVAGCLEDDVNPDDDQENGDEPEPTENGSDSDSSGYSSVSEPEYVRYAHSGLEETPRASLFTEAEAVTTALSEGSIDDEQLADIETFVDETDFESASIVQVVAQSPDLCHELSIEEVVEVVADPSEDSESVEEVLVDVEIGEDPEAGGACAQQVLTLGALVRVSIGDDSVDGGGEPVTQATVTVTDAQGDQHSIGIGVEQDTEDGG